MSEKPIKTNTNIDFSSGNDGTISCGTDNSSWAVESGGINFGSCPSVRRKKRDINEEYAEYKYLLPNLSKEIIQVRVKEGYKDNPSIVKVVVNPEDVQDNEFVHGFNEQFQFDSLYNIDSLDVTYSDNVLVLRVDKREEEQYSSVEIG